MNGYSVSHMFSLYIYTLAADHSPPPTVAVQNTLSHTSNHPRNLKKSGVTRHRVNLVFFFF
jgi:hypothetical protein